MPKEGKSSFSAQDQRVVELVKEFQQGNGEAYDKIYSLTYPKIYFLVYKMVRDHYEAEDITQEIFMNAYQNLKDLKEPQTFKKWLNQIAWHRTLDYLKSRRMNSTAGCNLDSLLETDRLEPALMDSGEQILSAERKSVVMGAVDELNPMLRTTVLLRFFNDLKEREIAEIMDVPLGTVKRRLMIAKQQLSGKLTGVYSIFPYFFVRLASSEECREAAGFLGAFVPARMIIGKSALAAGLATGAVAAIVMQGPRIEGLQYYGTDSYVNMQRAQWKVESTFPIKTVEIEGKDWEIKGDNELYWVDIPENGSYVISVTDVCGQKERREIQISNVDADGPIYCSYEERGDQMVLRFQDSRAGINWDSIRFIRADGSEVESFTIDRKRGEAVLPIEEFPLRAQVEDLAGNYGVYELELNTLQLKERQEQGYETA